MQNISKYVQINDFMLLEYEFNRDGVTTNMTTFGGSAVMNRSGSMQFFNKTNAALGITNNFLELNSMPVDSLRTSWINNYTDVSLYSPYYDSAVTDITNSAFEYDTIKVHIVSGYNFDDVAGFMLQVRGETSTGLSDLSNFTYIKQPIALGSADVIKFATNVLYLGNRFYDKYIEFKVPSVYTLSGDSTSSSLPAAMQIKALSDVLLTYSTIPTYQSDINGNNTFTLTETLNVQLPVTSVADNFNAFIAESTNGDYIEYYATWADEIIGSYMGDIESGRIKLSTSNNPNDNYADFTDTYGSGSVKWVVMHEIYVYEQLPGLTGASSILTQKFAFTQEDGFSTPNLFRPVLINADLDVSYTIQYVCRLSNRMDGTQIIRRASFASTDPKKYGLTFTRLNVENIIPYKIFNRVESEKANIIEGSNLSKTKYVKVFYDVTNVVMNQFNEVYPDGIGPLFLKNGDTAYKFKFEKLNNSNNNRQNVDLSGAFNYAILFVLDDNTKLEIVPTYSSNMNTTLGELEFKITGDQSIKLLQQSNKKYSIVVKNPDNTSYVFYEGVYYDNADYQATINSLKQSLVVGDLNNKIAQLEVQVKALTDENASLKTK